MDSPGDTNDGSEGVSAASSSTSASPREKLLSGEPLHFDRAAPQEARTVDAQWLEEAARGHIKIDVDNAVIENALNLKYIAFDDEVSLTHCDFKAPADLSFTTFNRNLNLSSSTFHQGVDFSSASAQYDLVLNYAKFLSWKQDATSDGRESPFQCIFLGLHVCGNLLAEGVCFGKGVRADFRDARLAKHAVFDAGIFEGVVDFVGMHVGGDANFHGAVFKCNASFSEARIDQIAFFNENTERKLRPARFKGAAEFRAVHIGASAEFKGVRFIGKDSLVDFEQAVIAGSAHFESCRFWGEADFSSTQIAGQAAFQDAVFKKKARFSRAHMEVAIFIGAEFVGTAEFRGVHITGQLYLSTAEFKRSVYFDGARVDGDALVGIDYLIPRDAATFRGVVSFNDVRIGGTAIFDGVVFNERTLFNYAEFGGSAEFHFAQFRAESNPSFVGTQFRKGAFFSGTVFDSEVNFQTTVFNTDARFQSSTFKQKADFGYSQFSSVAHFNVIAPLDLKGVSLAVEHILNSASDRVDFTGKRDELIAVALESFQSMGAEKKQFLQTTFEGEVSFNHARFERGAQFEDVIFKGPVSFSETSFRSVSFSAGNQVGREQQFQSKVDLRGCIYDRIQVEWRSLLKRLDPYDRQPYSHLERVLRASGEDRRANEVYLERRRVERQQKWHRSEVGAWVADALYAMLANYGVRPYRLIVIPVMLIALGTLVFSRPDAVRLKPVKEFSTQSSAESGSAPGSSSSASAEKSTALSTGDAFRMSFRLFLPTEVPLVARWEPSDARFGLLRFADFATLLKLAGWILVPLGIAALTGVLRRVAP